MTPLPRVTPRYLCALHIFGWRNIAWGVSKGLLNHGDVIGFGLCLQNEQSSESELIFAPLDPEDASGIEAALKKLAAQEDPRPDDSADRWLFAVLLYSFETATSPEVLLQAVDEVYCDFEHPEEMYPFVPWLPPLDGYDPTEHTSEQNRRRLVNLVYDYLLRTAAKLGARPPKYRYDLLVRTDLSS